MLPYGPLALVLKCSDLFVSVALEQKKSRLPLDGRQAPVSKLPIDLLPESPEEFFGARPPAVPFGAACRECGARLLERPTRILPPDPQERDGAQREDPDSDFEQNVEAPQ